MNQVRCRVTYHGYSNKNLIKFCSLVASGIYNNPSVFVSPSIPSADFATVQTKFSDAVSKYDNAPKIEKTNMENARKNLMSVLDKTKDYVDVIAQGDASIIILAGFIPTKGVTEKSKPVELTNNFTLKRGETSGQAEVTIDYKGTGLPQWYFAICSTDDSLPSNLVENGILNFGALPDGVRVDISKAKKKLFTNLDSGVIYYFYVLVANTVNVSLLSDPKSLKIF